MKNISKIIVACLYKEGLVVFLILGVILYFIACVNIYYGSENNSLRVFLGVGICSIPAILAVVMASGIRALETRKTIGLFPNIKLLLLQSAVLVCLFGSAFIIPYFYMVGFRGFRVLVTFCVSFFYVYSLILMFGVLLAKYISPALSFALVLVVVASGLFLIRTTINLNFSMAVIGVFFLSSLLLPIFWLKKKQEMSVDNGQNWIATFTTKISSIMHYPQSSSLTGTILINNGDSLKSILKRSSIFISASSIFLIIYCFSIKSNSSSPELILIFGMVQIVYIELVRDFRKTKSAWLLIDGDRATLFKNRAALHTKIAAIHYGLTITIVCLVLMIFPFALTAENISILTIIPYALIMHLLYVYIPAELGGFSIFPFLYFPLFFGKNMFEMGADSGLVLSNNIVELFLVFGFPAIFIVIAISSKGKIHTHDFTRKMREADFLRIQRNV